MAHLGEVRGTLEEIESMGARVLAVSFATPEAAATYAREHELPFALASDPTREAYGAFGLERAPAWRVFRPSAVLQHVALRLRGLRAGSLPDDDVYQLGGDFVIGADGVLRFAHASVAGDDRPAASELVHALRSA